MTDRILYRNSNLFWISLAITTLFIALPLTTKGQTPRRDYQYTNAPLASLLEEIAKPACANLVIDDTANDVVNSTTLDFHLSNATSIEALRLLFNIEKLNYDYVGKALVVYKGSKPKQLEKNLRKISFGGDFGSFISRLATLENLKATFDVSLGLTNKYVTFDISDSSATRALQVMLEENGLTYEHTSCDDILILKRTAVLLLFHPNKPKSEDKR